MKIVESRSTYELFVVLTDIEALLYQEVFRTQMPVAIPELGNKKFIIKEMAPYHGAEAQENSWHLVVEQQNPEVMAQSEETD
jgi:hypothetical protein